MKQRDETLRIEYYGMFALSRDISLGSKHLESNELFTAEVSLAFIS